MERKCRSCVLRWSVRGWHPPYLSVSPGLLAGCTIDSQSDLIPVILEKVDVSLDCLSLTTRVPVDMVKVAPASSPTSFVIHRRVGEIDVPGERLGVCRGVGATPGPSFRDHNLGGPGHPRKDDMIERGRLE